MNQTLTPIDEIKDLYSQVKRKNDFMKALAESLGKKPNTLKNHWFSGFFSIPDEHLEETKTFLQSTIKKQE